MVAAVLCEAESATMIKAGIIVLSSNEEKYWKGAAERPMRRLHRIAHRCERWLTASWCSLSCDEANPCYTSGTQLSCAFGMLAGSVWVEDCKASHESTYGSF